MIVRVSGALLRFTEYRRNINVTAPTVHAGLTELAEQFHPLRPVLFDREGRVRRTHKIFLNGEQLNAEQLTHPAGEADSLDLLLAVSGG
jgi:hypothetical protein